MYQEKCLEKIFIDEGIHYRLKVDATGLRSLSPCQRAVKHAYTTICSVPPTYICICILPPLALATHNVYFTTVCLYVYRYTCIGICI